MRIAACSDAHGAQRKMDALLDALPPVDVLCFLGDMDKDAAYLDYGLQERQPKAAFYAVAGNNDPFSQMAKTVELSFAGVKTMITHGHLFRGIRTTRSVLAGQAKRLGCQLVLYGHTHVQLDELIDGVRLVNPGALMLGEWALVEVSAGGVTLMQRCGL